MLTRAARTMNRPKARCVNAQGAPSVRGGAGGRRRTWRRRPIGDLLTEALNETPSPELAEEMVTRLPESTVALGELAVVATQQALQRAGAQTAGPERDQSTADLLFALSNRLSNLGRREEALDANEKSIEIWRRLADAQPDVFLRSLARALNSRSDNLADLGRREEALAATDEALPIFRQLAEARPDTLVPDLASILDTRSNRLADLGRYDEALEASEEAVAILRASRRLVPGPGCTTSLPSWETSPTIAHVLAVPRRRWPRATKASASTADSRKLSPTRSSPSSPSACSTSPPPSPTWVVMRRRWPRMSKPSGSTGGWPRPARRLSFPSSPGR